MPDGFPHHWEELQALAPSDPELRGMVADLRAAIGGQTLARLLRVRRQTVNSWIAGRQKPTAPSLAGVWMLWLMVCRPGAVETVQDLLTWGRFTRHGGPEHAGRLAQGGKSGRKGRSWRALKRNL